MLCCCVGTEPHRLRRKRACLIAENFSLKVNTAKLELIILKVGVGSHRWPLGYLGARWLPLTTPPPCEGVSPMYKQGKIPSFVKQRSQWNNVHRSRYR